MESRKHVTYSLARRHNDEWSMTVGSFKTPTMRNVVLTGPYFHDGGHDSLDKVLDHYRVPLNNLGAGEPVPSSGIALEREGQPRATAIPESAHEPVIEFLKSLTDSRVQNGLAPFDHPSLKVPVSDQVDAQGRTPDELMQSSNAPTFPIGPESGN